MHKELKKILSEDFQYVIMVLFSSEILKNIHSVGYNEWFTKDSNESLGVQPLNIFYDKTEISVKIKFFKRDYSAFNLHFYVFTF